MVISMNIISDDRHSKKDDDDRYDEDAGAKTKKGGTKGTKIHIFFHFSKQYWVAQTVFSA